MKEVSNKWDKSIFSGWLNVNWQLVLIRMATNTCQSVNVPGIAVKATFQSRVWVGGESV